jgi:pimeloyl-ACP methyl ester carboxylesterase
MGGLYARLYTHEHPDRVVGMVLVDSGHEETNQRLPEGLVKAEKQVMQILRIPQVLSAIGLLARDPAGLPGDSLPPQAPGTEEAHNAIQAMSPRYFSTLIEEHAAVEESYAVMRKLQDRSLGDLLLVVISAGEFPALAEGLITAEEQALVTAVEAQLQADLATLSSNSRQVIAEDAGHYVHLDQPELVIDAIRAVLNEAQQ